MKRYCRVTAVVVMISAIAAASWAEDAVRGWRGNWTGRFPEATPVTTWAYAPKSPAHGLKYQARKPKEGDTGADAKLVYTGDVAHWLTLGPFTAKDSAAALDESFAGDEAQLQPDAGDKLGEQAWTLLEPVDYRDNFTPAEIKKNVYGPYSLGWLSRPVKLPGKGANQVGYAHAYLYAQTAGQALLIVNHADGMKAWVNGKEVYREVRKNENFYFYEMDIALTRLMVFEPCARFEVTLDKGWNRLLLKLARKDGAPQFNLRVTAPEGTPYESKNVRWAAPMPSWSNATPVVVGDRIFVTSEPDELICVNRADGKVLWRRVNTVYDTLSDAEKASNPLFKEIEPIAAELAKGASADRGTVLRAKMREILAKIDKEKYVPVTEQGHISAIGYACPTPVSDGKRVYAFFAPGVVVCYDLDGNRRWIANVMDLGRARSKDGHLVETSPNCASPVLVDGRFIVFKGWFRAFDALTGQVAWDTGQISKEFDMSHGGVPEQFCAQSCVPVRVDGVGYVLGFRGRLLRASDGKVTTVATLTPHVYCTPVVDGNVAYIFGAFKCELSAEGGEVKAKPIAGIEGVSQFTVSSPLVHDGLIYALNAEGILIVTDAATCRIIYSQRLDMWPLFHFNAIGAVPSVALGGKHVYLMDNLGTTIVIEPGRAFKQVALNRIDTLTRPPWPLNTMERFEASPVFDRDEMFVRGHAQLYCIGSR
jgi:outer membrane protein assembly factor BamB